MWAYVPDLDAKVLECTSVGAKMEKGLGYIAKCAFDNPPEKKMFLEDCGVDDSDDEMVINKM